MQPQNKSRSADILGTAGGRDRGCGVGANRVKRTNEKEGGGGERENSELHYTRGETDRQTETERDRDRKIERQRERETKRDREREKILHF